jgi:hypothetical protein
VGETSRRYEYVQDPCGLWLVWDGQTEEPATLSGVALLSLSEEEASSLAALLNQTNGDDRTALPESLRRAS